jgi:hypothetical protein
LGEQVHFPLELLHALGPGGIVVDNPGGKANGIFHFQAQAVQALAGLGQRAATVEVGLQRVHPDLDGAEAGLGGHFQFFHEAQFMAFDGAHVQAVDKAGLGGLTGRRLRADNSGQQ